MGTTQFYFILVSWEQVMALSAISVLFPFWLISVPQEITFTGRSLKSVGS